MDVGSFEHMDMRGRVLSGTRIDSRIENNAETEEMQ